MSTYVVELTNKVTGFKYFLSGGRPRPVPTTYSSPSAAERAKSAFLNLWTPPETCLWDAEVVPAKRIAPLGELPEGYVRGGTR